MCVWTQAIFYSLWTPNTNTNLVTRPRGEKTTEKTTTLRSRGLEETPCRWWWWWWYSQLMQMILIIVNAKNGRGSIFTFTSTAVRRNTTKMTDRLPEILSFWGILGKTSLGNTAAFLLQLILHVLATKLWNSTRYASRAGCASFTVWSNSSIKL